jgi:hypothetical protein
MIIDLSEEDIKLIRQLIKDEIYMGKQYILEINFIDVYGQAFAAMNYESRLSKIAEYRRLQDKLIAQGVAE